LSAAHSAHARRQDEASAQVVAEMAFGDAAEDLIGALDDPLRADVLPVARRQSAPADQVVAFPLVEIFRPGPLADHIAVRHDDDGRLRMRAQHAYGLARLHDQGLVLFQFEQGLDDGVMRRPIARGAAEGRIYDQVRGVFAHGEHVFQQAQQRFLAPALATQDIAARDIEFAFHVGLPQDASA
jgi:hypothetical protein